MDAARGHDPDLHGDHGGGHPGGARERANSDWNVRQAQVMLFLEDDGSARKCNGELRLLFHKQRQGRSMAVQEILIPNGSNFTVTEETRKARQVKM